jgi:hypothetical protein
MEMEMEMESQMNQKQRKTNSKEADLKPAWSNLSAVSDRSNLTLKFRLKSPPDPRRTVRLYFALALWILAGAKRSKGSIVIGL